MSGIYKPDAPVEEKKGLSNFAKVGLLTLAAVTIFGLGALARRQPQATPLPTPTPVVVQVPVEVVVTATPTNTPTAATSTAIPIPASTPQPTRTLRPTSTYTPRFTSTPRPTPTRRPTATHTARPPPTPTPTNTPRPTNTPIPTPTPVPTATPTNTPLPPTSTPIPPTPTPAVNILYHNSGPVQLSNTDHCGVNAGNYQLSSFRMAATFTPGGTGEMRLMSVLNRGNPNWFVVRVIDGKVRLQYWPSPTAGAEEANSNRNIADTRHHVEITYQQGTYAIRVDGEQVITAFNPYVPPQSAPYVFGGGECVYGYMGIIEDMVLEKK